MHEVRARRDVRGEPGCAQRSPAYGSDNGSDNGSDSDSDSDSDKVFRA